MQPANVLLECKSRTVRPFVRSPPRTREHFAGVCYTNASLAIKSSTPERETALVARARAGRVDSASCYIYSPKHAHQQHTELIHAEIGFLKSSLNAPSDLFVAPWRIYTTHAQTHVLSEQHSLSAVSHFCVATFYCVHANKTLSANGSEKPRSFMVGDQNSGKRNLANSLFEIFVLLESIKRWEFHHCLSCKAGRRDLKLIC